MTWFQTASGAIAYVHDPDASTVTIGDIAAHLSRICRFNGALRDDVHHYSVAQHSILVSRACPPELALVGLLHDATEAYCQDIIRPLKHAIRSVYEPIERAWSARIGREFGIGDELVELHPTVKEIDDRMLATEKRDLMSRCDGDGRLSAEPFPGRIIPMSYELARDQFMRRFHMLCDMAGWSHPQGR